MKVNKIWGQLASADLVVLLDELCAANKWTESEGTIKGCCVFHQENTPSTYINVDKGFYKCYGCGHYSSDPIHVLAAAGNLSYVEAYSLLRKRFGLRKLGSKFTAEVQADDRNQRIKKELASAFQKELINAAQAKDNPHYANAQRTVQWLRQRGVDDGYHLLPIGVVPTIKRLRSLIADQDLVEDAVDYFSKWLKVEFLGALVFVYHTTPRRIARFRIRIPDSKKIYQVADSQGEAGFFGLGTSLYLPLVKCATAAKVLVVEGEFDQLAFLVNQIKTGVADSAVLSVGGASTTNLDTLSEFGFEQVYILADHPNYSGDTIVKGILEHTSKVPMRIFQWPSSVSAKDPDQAINVKYDYEKAYGEFTNPDNYKLPHIWAFTRASRELKALDKDDIRRRDQTIGEWGSILLDEGERVAFLNAVAKDLNVPYNQVAKSVVAAQDDEMGFVSRLESAILDVYDVIGEESVGATSYLYVWNKKKKLIRKLALARFSEVEVELSKDVGILSQWTTNVVGEPDFIKFRGGEGEKNKPIGLLEKESRIRSYVSLAFKNVLSNASNYKLREVKSQGIHYLPCTHGKETIIVNGRDAYKGHYEKDSTHWEKLDSPAYDKYLLDLSNSVPWSVAVSGVEALNSAVDVDLRSIYDTLHDMLMTGWSFMDQDVEAQFLAAQTMVAPISTVFKRQTYVFITAEASSGKSRLTLGFFGGSQFPSINVVEASEGFDDYTEAGFRQTMNNKSLMCCLDEFEDDGTNNSKSYEVRKILKVLRNIMGVSNRVVKGTPSGESRVFYLRFPVVMSAISTVREPADISRLITIRMRTDRCRVDPVVSITEKYSVEEIEDVRHGVTLGALPHLPKLVQHYTEVEKEYARGEGLPVGTQTRFREGLYPALAMMKLIGLDYQKFMYEFCETKAALVNKIATASENDEILNAILNSPSVMARLENRISNTTTVAELLSREDTRDLLNTTGCGAYYYQRAEDEHWLAVNWTQAIQGVLRAHPKYKHERSAGHIKEMAERANTIVPEDKIRRAGILRRLMGAAGKLSNITVYDVTRLIEDMSSIDLSELTQNETIDFDV